MFNPQLGMNGGFDPSMMMNPHLMQVLGMLYKLHAQICCMTPADNDERNCMLQGLGMPPMGNMQGEI